MPGAELLEGLTERVDDVLEGESVVLEPFADVGVPDGESHPRGQQVLEGPDALDARFERALEALGRDLVVVLAIARQADALDESHLLEQSRVVADAGLADAEGLRDVVE
jgi:hypothetical protein